MASHNEATVEDLSRVEGKAELVGGKLVLMTAASWRHGHASIKIAASLLEHAQRTKKGIAFGDNVGFIVNLPNRRSFSPDAAFCADTPHGPGFVDGAPVFAAEVRSEKDYGPVAERAMAEKRADYFAAGTLVVWDVDVLREQIVRVYRANDPTAPTTYRRGEAAEADPAVPGWTMPVSALLPPA